MKSLSIKRRPENGNMSINCQLTPENAFLWQLTKMSPNSFLLCNLLFGLEVHTNKTMLLYCLERAIQNWWQNKLSGQSQSGHSFLLRSKVGSKASEISTRWTLEIDSKYNKPSVNIRARMSLKSYKVEKSYESNSFLSKTFNFQQLSFKVLSWLAYIKVTLLFNQIYTKPHYPRYLSQQLHSFKALYQLQSSIVSSWITLYIYNMIQSYNVRLKVFYISF